MKKQQEKEQAKIAVKVVEAPKKIEVERP